MAVIDLAPPRPAPVPVPPPVPSRRDASIDLVRALCVPAVMLVHGLQVTATLGAAGPVLEYATRGAAWYPPITWLLQVMPLFFVVSGFAGAIAHRRLRERGGTATAFVTARVHRLLVPLLAPVAAAVVVLAALGAAGVQAGLLDEAGLRWREPLWFLAVFLGVQSLLPLLLRAHERAPWASLAALAGGAVAVDLLRGQTGIEAIGYANLGFVWLALQQAGFLLADGRIDALPRRVRAAGIVLALAGLGTAFVTGFWSPDLIAHLNPPTTALLVLGAAQTLALSLARPHLARLAARPRIAAVTGFVTARTMTFYLWNLSALLLLAGGSLLLSQQGLLTLPEPSSAAWWASRPLWLAASIALTAAAAWLAGPLERLRPVRPTHAPRRTAQAVLLGLAGLLVLLAAGISPLSGLLALALLLGALARIRGPRSGEPEISRSPVAPTSSAPALASR
ncbi:acyltransferase [Brachybacterium sp. NBEC-018]|uniref:acyltransferase family protein n=1 Tax=Brachybacterium sp. NBEC-018 TaxID=2996004 RepID=UPI0021752548|nr:acyltransferase [Brachybacterium sp. NBEC-018]UVY84662.1 acyltransferase [Brachybacterium sp. NBEC-018]